MCDSNVLFQEIQKQRQWWLWILLICSLIIVTSYNIATIISLNSKTVYHQNPAEVIISLAIGPVILLAVIILLYYSKLVTEVRYDGVYIRYTPFHRSFRCLPFSEIESYEARTYSPIAEYGGWGIRWGWKGGNRNIAYNVSGNKGVQLVLKDGRRILIGSQKPEELVAAIKSATSRSIEG